MTQQNNTVHVPKNSTLIWTGKKLAWKDPEGKLWGVTQADVDEMSRLIKELEAKAVEEPKS